MDAGRTSGGTGPVSVARPEPESTGAQTGGRAAADEPTGEIRGTGGSGNGRAAAAPAVVAPIGTASAGAGAARVTAAPPVASSVRPGAVEVRPGIPVGGTAMRAATGDRTGSGAVPRPATGRPTGPRRARLLVTRLDPWSVMKTFFMLSLAVAIVLVVATALLWWTLDVTGTFAAVDRTVDDVVGTGPTGFDFMTVVPFDRVMGAALVLSAVEIILVSAMATLFAFLYNLTVGFTRGLEVTLTEDNQ